MVDAAGGAKIVGGGWALTAAANNDCLVLIPREDYYRTCQQRSSLLQKRVSQNVAKAMDNINL